MCVATRGGGEARPECRSRPTQPITEKKERPRLYPVLPEKPEDLLDPAVVPPPYPLQRPDTTGQKEETKKSPEPSAPQERRVPKLYPPPTTRTWGGRVRPLECAPSLP